MADAVGTIPTLMWLGRASNVRATRARVVTVGATLPGVDSKRVHADRCRAEAAATFAEMLRSDAGPGDVRGRPREA